MKEYTRAVMDRGTALRLLRSESVLDRRQAARFFAQTKSAEDAIHVRTALADESDYWVRERLRTSIGQGEIKDEQPASSDEIGGTAALSDETRTRALSEVIDAFLHELSPLIAEVDRRAAAEIPDFEDSRTHEAVQRLLGYLQAMHRLQSVTGYPNIVELDLTDLVSHLASRAVEDSDAVKVFVTRDEPLFVKGDAAFLELAIENGLRNAIEASSPGHEILINLGTTDRDAWVTILDQGIGLPAGADKVWEPGRTTKPKSQHRGFGLSIARQAILSLNGSISLRPRKNRGTAFEVRWPHREAL